MNDYNKEWLEIFSENVVLLAQQNDDFADTIITSFLFDFEDESIVDKIANVLEDGNITKERIVNIMQSITMNPYVLGKIADKLNTENGEKMRKIYNKIATYGLNLN